MKRQKTDFGIRFEQFGGQWVADWAFRLRPGVAHCEGYDKQHLSGNFKFANTYLGCPGCKAGSIFLCACGKVACWDGKSRTVVCPWCGQILVLQRDIESLRGGQDR
jgi:hypothetical protein